MNKHIWKNIGAKTVFILIIVTVLMAILIPVLYFFSLSMFSGSETYQFPQRLLPKLSFDVRVEYIQDKYKIDLYHDDIDDYEPLIKTARMSDIVRIFKRQLSVERTEDELFLDFKPSINASEPITIHYKKSMCYNFKSFFSVTNDAASALINSITAALWTILISVTLGSMAGYAIARYRFRGRSQANIMMLIVRMFPVVSISIPMAVILIEYGLFDSMLGLAVIYSIPNIALTAWITNSIFLGISVDLEEASHVFGAGKMQTFFRITLPLALPGLAASSMYAFLAAWNDTITALVLTNRNQTLSLMIYKALGGSDAQFQIAAAGSIILILPALVFTFIIKNYIGQMWGEVKM